MNTASSSTDDTDMEDVQQLLLVQQRVGHAYKIVAFAQMIIPVRQHHAQLRCSLFHVLWASWVLAFKYAEFGLLGI